MGESLPFPERRKSARQIIQLNAIIERAPNLLPLSCLIVDMSVMGARISTSNAALPNEFTLLLSRDGPVRRNCKVVWRHDFTVGVQFMPPAQL
ncbi:MAG: PilZ domain-containing protein [Rhizobiales bacterium]|nr:PilZ domain-containing protein [Hyphomicrobiales bacterium]